MMKLILLRGYPGSGKTTLGKTLENINVGIFIDHNAILTFIAGIVGDDDGIYEEIHSLEKSMVEKLLSNGKSVIVARGFSNSFRAEQYISIARRLNAKVHIFTLSADIDILAQRVQSEERKKDYNPTVTPEALYEWISNNKLEPIEGEKIIDASASTKSIVKEVKRILDS